MGKFLEYAYFIEVGMFFTLGCLVTVLWIKLMYDLLDYIIGLFGTSIRAKEFNPHKDYALYASILLGSVRYYIVGIGKDNQKEYITYALSKDTNPGNEEIVLTIKKPLS